jgi:hypothetical protein
MWFVVALVPIVGSRVAICAPAVQCVAELVAGGLDFGPANVGPGAVQRCCDIAYPEIPIHEPVKCVW